MRVLTIKLIRHDAFKLIRIDILIFVTIVKLKNNAVCLTIIKYIENRRNYFKTDSRNMIVLTLILIRNDNFALIHLGMLTFVTIIKVKNYPLCLIVIKYKENRNNNFKDFE